MRCHAQYSMRRNSKWNQHIHVYIAHWWNRCYSYQSPTLMFSVQFQLNQNGFTNIDALEPAVGMVEEAKKKGVYINYIIDLIGGREAHIEDGIMLLIS